MTNQLEKLYTKSWDLSNGKLLEDNLYQVLAVLKKTKIVEQLNVSNNKTLLKFARQLALALTANHSVTHLNLSKNDIDPEIAAALLANDTVTHLDLSDTRISEESIKNIMKNKNLHYLNLCCTFYHGETGSVCSTLKQNNTLREVDLSWNDIQANGMKEIAAVLSENTSLQYLNLSHNQIYSHNANELFEAMLINRNLTDLNLSYNFIGPNSLNELTEMLRQNTTLVRLDLSGNKLDSTTAKEIALALLQNRTITDLNLSLNRISPGEDARNFAIFLLQNENLTTLNLSGNELGDEAVHALAMQLRCNKTLTKLILAEDIGLPIIKDLALALKQNNTLSSLSLVINKDYFIEQVFGQEAVKEIVNALMTSTAITVLDLSGNSAGPDGARAISEFLKHNRNLVDLNFSHNDIGPEGAADIASALIANDCLINLNLEQNSIGPEGTKELCKVLKQNKTLSNLNISFNPVNADTIGIKYLTDTLRCNYTLSCLDIGGHYLGPNAVKELAASIKVNKTIRILGFDHRDVKSNTLKEIHHYLERNRNLIRKVTSIAKYIYTNRAQKELIFVNISKKYFEDFEGFQAKQEMIKTLSEFNRSVKEATEIIDYSHFFLKTHFFEIAGILEHPFDKLPLDILCKISSFLKLRDVHS